MLTLVYSSCFGLLRHLAPSSFKEFTGLGIDSSSTCGGLENQGSELGQLQASSRLLLSGITALMLDVENQCFIYFATGFSCFRWEINLVPVFSAWPKAGAKEPEISLSLIYFFPSLCVCIYHTHTHKICKNTYVYNIHAHVYIFFIHTHLHHMYFLPYTC